MNRRLFFMFITKLAKVPRNQILQLLPQIRVVKAFQSSVKKSKEEKNKKKEDQNNKSKEEDDDIDYFSQKKEESPEKKNEDDKEKDECRKKRRDDDDETDDMCFKYPKKKEVHEEKLKERKAVGTQMSPCQEARARSAYEQSFGNRKYRK